MDELTKEFLAESLEGLNRVDSCLTALELRPDDAGLLGEIFRAVHTIKGTTGFLGFSRLEKLAHSGEHLLGLLRDGRLSVTADLVSGLLRLMDGLRLILQLIELTGQEGDRAEDHDAELIASLEALSARSAAPDGSRLPGTDPIGAAPSPLQVDAWSGLEGSRVAIAPQPAKVDSDEEAGKAQASCGSRRGEGAGRDGTGAEAAAVVGDPGAGAAATTAGGGVSENTLRINVDVLNRLVNLVGELVLTRNQLLRSRPDASSFPELIRRLDSVTIDLRETVMEARMQPVGHLFSRFPRMVRDIARSCGKQVRLEFSGNETGLDKGLLEAIKDPLTHAVRNAIDHGIETPEARILAGKPAEGVLSLSACHHGGSVLIEVIDDGGGISTERVLEKAIERGLITPEAAVQMSDREALQLIFLPGFSTAAKVTHLSGRGVGMDVVRANVERVSGTVEMESHVGKGTALRLRVPLTLAIVPALVVGSGGESFCLPQGTLAELVYVPEREVETAIETIGGARLYRLRDRLLPLVWLDELLQLRQPGAPRRFRADHGFYLAVLDVDGCRFGLAVDDLLAPEEIVVKPLGAVIREIGLFSGATVLGNGALALILEPSVVASRAGVRPLAEKAAALEGPVPVSTQPAQPAFLLFEDHAAGGGRRAPEQRALPIEAVERIESVPFHEIEWAAGEPLLQYGDVLLPLEDAGGLLEQDLWRAEQADEEPMVTILICERRVADGQAGRSDAGELRRFGLVVRRVVDVADGEWMHEDHVCPTERLALVNKRVTVLHEAFAAGERWREVA